MREITIGKEIRVCRANIMLMFNFNVLIKRLVTIILSSIVDVKLEVKGAKAWPRIQHKRQERTKAYWPIRFSGEGHPPTTRRSRSHSPLRAPFLGMG